ncbi:carboxypeptidase-like regulatory domain-containing protein, partial [Arthrospira platensis SPKY1]|nr:carboxypeptidase-like regulatory domain-containing protein [Arthrospira platensis SPKY1]
MNSFFKHLLPVVIGVLLYSFTMAQTATVRGVITDKSTGETMPGANVLVKGTLIGTSTDFDGL